MRQARLKPIGQPVFYHLYNRVAGDPSDRPFGPAEKEKFVQLLHKLDLFFSVRVLSYQVMSNHFHLVVQAPDCPPAIDEICNRYNAYYGRRRALDPSDPRCRIFGERMRDISWYMHSLEHQFSSWYNRTRRVRRRGSLWAARFKNTVLGDEQAVWECCKYVEMNAVRAGLVSDPGAYRFSSYGAWCGTRRHPFEKHVREVLLPWVRAIYPFESLGALKKSLAATFAEVRGVHKREKDNSTFHVHLDRRVRYWVDGLVIGSELFVREMVARHGPILGRRSRGLIPAWSSDPGGIVLYCCKRLRAV